MTLSWWMALIPPDPPKACSRAFFENCRRLLKPGGVFGTQSESPEAFRDVHIAMVRLLREVFDHADPLYGWVPNTPPGFSTRRQFSKKARLNRPSAGPAGSEPSTKTTS